MQLSKRHVWQLYSSRAVFPMDFEGRFNECRHLIREFCPFRRAIYVDKERQIYPDDSGIDRRF
jgi:hypothetical protein